MLRRAVDLGVTFIDTANWYGPHISETLIAEALAPYPSELVIGTKGGFDRPGPGQWRTNGRPEHLRAELEGSLRRLKLERIDLYQLHRIDPAVPEDEQFGVLQAFQREGKIRHIGLSEVSVDQVARARRSFPVVSVQNRYNVVDRQSEDVVNYCDREGIAFIPWYPLLVGKVGETSSALATLAAGHGVSPMQMALAWLLARSPVMLPDSGHVARGPSGGKRGRGGNQHVRGGICRARLRPSARIRRRVRREGTGGRVMMSRRRFAWMASAALAACLAGAFTAGARIAAQSLPSRLSDQEFWKLSSESSEPNGYFRSDNLLSNETGFQYVIPDLIRTTKPGRVYMGVGPEQNFTYIVATKPSMVFIVDIRRGNLDLQLMYKALFELSADRAEFVSRLFSKKRPDGLDAQIDGDRDLRQVLERRDGRARCTRENLAAATDDLSKKHGFGLSPDDLRGIGYVYDAFYQFGPRIQYSSTGSFGAAFQPNFSDLMTAHRSRGDGARLSGDRRELPVHEGSGGPQRPRAGCRQLRRPEGHPRGRPVSEGEGRDGVGVLLVERRAVPPAGRHLERLLRERRRRCRSTTASTFIRSVRRTGDAAPGFGFVSELGNILSDVKACRPVAQHLSQPPAGEPDVA